MAVSTIHSNANANHNVEGGNKKKWSYRRMIFFSIAVSLVFWSAFIAILWAIL